MTARELPSGIASRSRGSSWSHGALLQARVPAFAAARDAASDQHLNLALGCADTVDQMGSREWALGGAAQTWGVCLSRCSWARTRCLTGLGAACSGRC